MHGTRTVWAGAFAVLAVCFPPAMATGLRSRLPGASSEEAVTLPAPSAAQVGRTAMGGVMAVMPLLTA